MADFRILYFFNQNQINDREQQKKRKKLFFHHNFSNQKSRKVFFNNTHRLNNRNNKVYARYKWITLHVHGSLWSRSPSGRS